MFLIRRVFPLLALFVFASGSTRRGLALSNGEGLLGNNEKSVPSVRPSSVDNLILSAAKDASEERDALEEKQMPIKYNPEAIYNHIVNVKVPHHREKFDRIAKHFPIWENSLQHVQKKLYEGSLRTAALKMASMNASELQVENVNDYVVNTILNKFAYPLHGIDLPSFQGPVIYPDKAAPKKLKLEENSNSTNSTNATTSEVEVEASPMRIVRRGRALTMEPKRHTFRRHYILDAPDLDHGAGDKNTTKQDSPTNHSATIANKTSSFGQKLLSSRAEVKRRRLLQIRKMKAKSGRRRKLLKGATNVC